MFRRPVAVRRGPGVVGTMARTAVIAGTATATSRAVSGAMQGSAEKKQQAADTATTTEQNQAQIEQMQAQLNTMQAAPVTNSAPAASPANDDMLAKLNQLAQLKADGVLTEEEFTAAKAKLLS